MFKKECKLTQVNKRTLNSAKYFTQKNNVKLLLNGLKEAGDGNSKALFIWSQVPETTLPRGTVGEKFFHSFV